MYLRSARNDVHRVGYVAADIRICVPLNVFESVSVLYTSFYIKVSLCGHMTNVCGNRRDTYFKCFSILYENIEFKRYIHLCTLFIHLKNPHLGLCFRLNILILE